MIKVYLSSTYQDLVKYRESATSTLRQMNKGVVGMEDYTASDERPLDRCLADVGRCDLYVGIFAWRYGYIPPHKNDQGKSITQLEYEHAETLEKPRLIFLVADGAAWPPPDLDHVTGEGDRGKKVQALREHLKTERMCKFFATPEDLALQLSTAVSNWLEKKHGSVDQTETTNAPLPRDITKDICLIHTELDTDYATEVARHLSAQGLRVVVDRMAIFADGLEDFLRVEGTLRTCHGTMILVSDGSLRQMREQPRLDTLMELAAGRAGPVMALCRSKDAIAAAAKWNLAITVDVEAWEPRQSATPPALAGDRLAQLWPGLGSAARWVGLPVVVASMTLGEARDLHANARQIEDKLSKSALEQLKVLKASMPTEAAMMQRYGPRRDRWHPFGADQPDISTLLRTMVNRLNSAPPSRLRARMIKLQYYPLDELMRDKEQLRPVFNEMAGNGCVLIIDEYSLFHPDLRAALASSKLLTGDRVSLVTVSPTNPYSASPFDLIEHELSERLTPVFERFSRAYDPQCELSVGDGNRLKRWLTTSMPQTVQNLQEPQANRQALAMFASEQNRELSSKTGSLLYSPGGTL